MPSEAAIPDDLKQPVARSYRFLRFAKLRKLLILGLRVHSNPVSFRRACVTRHSAG